MAGKKGSKHTKKRVIQPPACLSCGAAVYCKGLCRKCYYKQPHIIEKRRPYMVKWRQDNKKKINESCKQYYRKNSQAWRERDVKSRYGVTHEEYQTLMQRPCAICGEEAQAMDHDHKTGKLRDPLCGLCNVGLGMFKDSPELLIAATAYLRRHILDGGDQ